MRDAIDRIAELAKPYTLSTNDGHRYSNVDLHEVKPEVELPARYSVDTLEALVKLIRTEGIDHSPRLYVRVDSARRVMVDTTYTHKEYAEFSRLPLYEAVSDVPSISVNQYMSQEHAVIELQSLYAVTEDRDYLLALLSRIDVNQGVSSVDNGISQEVSVRTGAVLKEQQTVQPIVHLQPYRTFLEVEQPPATSYCASTKMAARRCTRLTAVRGSWRPSATSPPIWASSWPIWWSAAMWW